MSKKIEVTKSYADRLFEYYLPRMEAHIAPFAIEHRADFEGLKGYLSALQNHEQ